MRLTVFFSTLDGVKLPFVRMCLVWFIRALTGSRIVHCAIGDGDVVFTSNLDGARYWPQDTFARKYPGVVAAVVVAAKPLDLAMFEYLVAKRLPFWPSFWRLLNGGGLLTGDCACTTLVALERAGIPVDRNITTPVGLFRWLKLQGYETHARGHAARCRRVTEVDEYPLSRAKP